MRLSILLLALTVSATSAAPCFNLTSPTHALNISSLQLTSAVNATYLRHSCWWAWTVGTGFGDPTTKMDTTYVIRLAVDGSAGLSLQSVNYENHYLTVQPDNYLELWPLSWLNTSVKRAAASFTVSSAAGGAGAKIIAHSPAPVGMFSYALTSMGAAGPHTCSAAATDEVGVALGGSGTWAFVPPFASPDLYAAAPEGGAPFTSNGIVVEPVGAAGAFLQPCGADGMAYALYTMAPPASANPVFTLTPPSSCLVLCNASVSNVSLISLVSATLVSGQSRGALRLGPGGDVHIAMIDNGAADDAASTLVAWRATLSGLSGWVIASAINYSSAAPLLLTFNAAAACVAGNASDACCSAGNGSDSKITFTPADATIGLSVAHLWRLFWEDGAGDVLTLPTPPAADVNASLSCIASSTTPSSTPSMTHSRNTTTTITVTASGTQSILHTSSQTQTVSATTSKSATSTATGTSSATASTSTTTTPTTTTATTPSASGDAPASWTTTSSASMSVAASATRFTSESPVGSVTPTGTTSSLALTPGSGTSPSRSLVLSLSLTMTRTLTAMHASSESPAAPSTLTTLTPSSSSSLLPMLSPSASTSAGYFVVGASISATISSSMSLIGASVRMDTPAPSVPTAAISGGVVAACVIICCCCSILAWCRRGSHQLHSSKRVLSTRAPQPAISTVMDVSSLIHEGKGMQGHTDENYSARASQHVWAEKMPVGIAVTPPPTSGRVSRNPTSAAARIDVEGDGGSGITNPFYAQRGEARSWRPTRVRQGIT